MANEIQSADFFLIALYLALDQVSKNVGCLCIMDYKGKVVNVKVMD